MAPKEPHLPPPLKVFVSYSHEDAESKAVLLQALQDSGERFEIFSDELLQPGDDWNEVLGRLRGEAEVFLLLVSPAYLQSEKIAAIELPHLLRRAEAGEAVVIPVILLPCEWHGASFARFQAVPRFGKPVSAYQEATAAYREVAEALQSLDDLRLHPEAAARIAGARQDGNKVLDLSGFGLRRVPRDLLELEDLEVLDLSGNFITAIENLEMLAKLRVLHLGGNGIETISGLEQLQALSLLRLDMNAISGLSGLDNLKSLRLLQLTGNRLESLRGIEQLERLEVLYADGNQLADIGALGDLPQLKCLVLIDNHISSLRPLLPLLREGLPVDLQATVMMHEPYVLDLYSNAGQNLDNFFLEGNPPGVYLNGNPVSDPSPEVIGAGTEAIIDHFDKIDRYGKKELEVLKLILIGNSGVGKTNLSQFFRGQDVAADHNSTDTLDIQRWRMPLGEGGARKNMRVNIFDFGGQDYYHDLHRLYYSYDTAYVLLWDKASNSYSEQAEKLADGTEMIYENFPLEYWLESIRYNLDGRHARPHQAPQPDTEKDYWSAGTEQPSADAAQDLSITAPVLVLQNKIDLGAGLLNQVDLHREYPNIAAFFSVSLSAGKRLNALQEVLYDCLKKLDLAGRVLVRYQHEVIERYLDGEADFQVLSLEAFREQCAALAPRHKDVLDLTDARTIASILTNLGVVYFDREAEGGIVFTSIGRLNELIKHIMNLAKQGSDKGIFLRAQVADLQHIDRVLPLLRRNQSIIALDAKRFLVPQFLPVEPDAQTAAFTRAFRHCQIRYVYTAYFHKTLLIDMFARFLSRPDDTPGDNSDRIQAISYWRNGLILSQGTGDDTQMVFVHFIKRADSCRIEIRSLHLFRKGGLEREVEAELDRINEGWTACKEVSVDSRDFFDVADMKRQVAENDFVFRGAHGSFTVNDFKHLVTFEKVPKKLFISYSSKDAEFVKRFWTHLNVLKAKGYIEPWYDRKIEPGAKWDDSIQKEMLSADLVIFLLSPDFLATSYIMDVELKKAIEMEEARQCELFFIQLMPCSWGETALDRYQMQLSPDAAGKSQSFIGTSGNDEMWKLYIESLTMKVKG